jgi:hypothetical protein
MSYGCSCVKLVSIIWHLSLTFTLNVYLQLKPCALLIENTHTHTHIYCALTQCLSCYLMWHHCVCTTLTVTSVISFAQRGASVLYGTHADLLILVTNYTKALLCTVADVFSMVLAWLLLLIVLLDDLFTVALWMLVKTLFNDWLCMSCVVYTATATVPTIVSTRLQCCM